MSLILEALRKSEAERRRGQAPDLHTELPPAVQSARSARPAWRWQLALAIIAVIAALAVTWLARGLWAPTRDTPDVVPAQLPDQVRASRDNPATIEPPRTSSPAAGTPPATEPSSVATTAPVKPASAPRTEPAAGASSTRDIDGVSDSRPAAEATATRPSATPVPRSPASTSIATPATPAAPPATADNGTPLQLSDLAAAERRALPPLAISMHMWAPTPAGRFAIIDGARVNEGDRLGEAVVDEITRDGVILAWHGRRVQVPIH